MPDSPQSPLSAQTSTSNETPAKHYPKEGRNVWIVTVYGIGGLVFFGVLAYYISNYFAK
jgi:hypothetical protein